MRRNRLACGAQACLSRQSVLQGPITSSFDSCTAGSPERSNLTHSDDRAAGISCFTAGRSSLESSKLSTFRRSHSSRRPTGPSRLDIAWSSRQAVRSRRRSWLPRRAHAPPPAGLREFDPAPGRGMSSSVRCVNASSGISGMTRHFDDTRWARVGGIAPGDAVTCALSSNVVRSLLVGHVPTYLLE